MSITYFIMASFANLVLMMLFSSCLSPFLNQL